MTILRQYSKEHPEEGIKPKPKIKVPRLTAQQLSLFD